MAGVNVKVELDIVEAKKKVEDLQAKADKIKKIHVEAKKIRPGASVEQDHPQIVQLVQNTVRKSMGAIQARLTGMAFSVPGAATGGFRGTQVAQAAGASQALTARAGLAGAVIGGVVTSADFLAGYTAAGAEAAAGAGFNVMGGTQKGLSEGFESIAWVKHQIQELFNQIDAIKQSISDAAEFIIAQEVAGETPNAADTVKLFKASRKVAAARGLLDMRRKNLLANAAGRATAHIGIDFTNRLVNSVAEMFSGGMGR